MIKLSSEMTSDSLSKAICVSQDYFTQNGLLNFRLEVLKI